MPFQTITFQKRRRLPFTTKNSLGQVDTTTVATVSSTKPTKVRATINPANNREVFVDGLLPNSPEGNATVTVSCNGKSASYDFAVPVPPDQSEVALGTPTAEEDIPPGEL